MTTKAGERLVCRACERGDRTAHAQHMREAEAVRDALTDLRAAVLGLDGLDGSEPDRVARAAVLAEIDKRTPGGAS